MTADQWAPHLARYLALRRALGFSMRPQEALLRAFLQYLDAHPVARPAVADIAVTWAATTGGHNHAQRLSVVRGFLAAVQAADPTFGVPGPGLVQAARRPRPHLYTATEVHALMEAAKDLGPRGSLRPFTVATVIGLLASCGLRASEAIGLDDADVDLTGTPPCLQVRHTKFRKSRVVPLHPTTAVALQQYRATRARLGYDHLCDAFFVSERGRRLTYHTLARAVVGLARRLSLRGPVGTRGASLHHLRHTFAVARLAAWTRAGLTVRDHLPSLAVYLGHVRPQETYWYLTAAPAVLEPAADRFEAFADRRTTP
jgi:integrase